MEFEGWQFATGNEFLSLLSSAGVSNNYKNIMTHSEFVEHYKNNTIIVTVDNAKAGYFFGDRTLLSKDAHKKQFSLRSLAFLNMLTGVILFFFLKWYIAMIFIVLGCFFATKATDSAGDSVLKASLADEYVYMLAIKNNTITIRNHYAMKAPHYETD